MEICYFAREGDLAEVRRLLEFDPDLINATDALFMLTPLSWAACRGHADIVKLLLDYGADAGDDGYTSTPLMSAVEEGYVECVRVLLDHPGSAHFWDHQCDGGWTALNGALHQPDPEIVRLLVQKGADVKDPGALSLFTPCKLGHVRVVRFLLELGVNPTVVNEHGAKAIDVARQEGHQECVTALEVRIPCRSP
jgi:ankyrin repeat-rich membrane spanning protein